MNVPPLCVIQARYHSTRLPGKMLLPLGGETLIARAWRIACEAFGAEHVVVAIPFTDSLGPLGEALDRIDARLMAWNGDENDVLGRFHHVAHAKRWHPDSVIVRYTPDDPFKTVDGLRRVGAGERLPVEIGGEAFTLAMLDQAHARVGMAGQLWGEPIVPKSREHITHAIFPTLPPSAPPGKVWTVDTQVDYEAALARLESESTGSERRSWDNCCLACTERSDCIRNPFDGGRSWLEGM